MPISHISLNVRDMNEMTTWYLAALKPLGYKLSMELVDGQVRGFAATRCGLDFWLVGPNAPCADGEERHIRGSGAMAGKEASPAASSERKLTGDCHIAFTACNRAQVRAFYEAAINAGGTCNGTPGVRPEYFATYYGAFVKDPEGRNIEAVCVYPAFWAESWGVGSWAVAGGVLAAVVAAGARWSGVWV